MINEILLSVFLTCFNVHMDHFQGELDIRGALYHGVVRLCEKQAYDIMVMHCSDPSIINKCVMEGIFDSK